LLNIKIYTIYITTVFNTISISGLTGWFISYENIFSFRSTKFSFPVDLRLNFKSGTNLNTNSYQIRGRFFQEIFGHLKFSCELVVKLWIKLMTNSLQTHTKNN
jgi:hypothetical protein